MACLCAFSGVPKSGFNASIEYTPKKTFCKIPEILKRPGNQSSKENVFAFSGGSY
jgi:hypothetical protein